MKRKFLALILLITIGVLPVLNNVYAGVTDIIGGSGVTVKTTVRDNYTDYQVTDNIYLEKDKDYIIDFSKEDNLSKGLSALADLEKTVYYKVIDGEKVSLCKTDDVSEAVIKIVGKKDENKAIMTFVNTTSDKSYDLDFTYTKYTGSKLTYTGTDYNSEEITVSDPDDLKNANGSSGKVTMNEIRDDYYSRYHFKCKLNLIAELTQDIQIDGTYNGFGMEISLNDVRVGEESSKVNGTAKGYVSGNIKNKITIQLAFGDGNIGSVTINGTVMTLPAGTKDRVEFSVEPAKKYTIVVTKSNETSSVPKTIIWDSDNTNNSSIKESELLKNGTIEILNIMDPNGNSVGLENVNQDLQKNNGWASILPGSKVIFRLKPNYGYQLTSITINDEKLVAGKEESTFEYIMPNTNVHISGIFEKVDDKVSVESEKIKIGTIQLGGNEIDSGSLILSVNDVTLTEEQISNFENKVSGYEISSYLDISLSQIIYKGTANDFWSNEMKDLNNEATITLKLENGVNGNEIVIVHEKHDGSYEVIPATYNKDTNTITFKTSSFSNYAIASKITNDNQNNIENPNTADNLINYVFLFAISSIALTTVVLVYNKKRI